MAPLEGRSWAKRPHAAAQQLGRQRSLLDGDRRGASKRGLAVLTTGVLDEVARLATSLSCSLGPALASGTAARLVKGVGNRPAALADDPIVARFRAEGAVIVGQTAMTEWGVTPLGWSMWAQAPRNPHNPRPCNARNARNPQSLATLATPASSPAPQVL